MASKAVVWVVECKHPKRKDDRWEPQWGTPTHDSRRLARGLCVALHQMYPSFAYRPAKYVREEKP